RDKCDSVDDVVISEKRIELIFRTIERFAPGLIKFLPAAASIYTCQKYNPAAGQARALRDYFFREVARSLFMFYPGKFTQSLIAADRIIEKITESYGPSRTATVQLSGDAWVYAHPG